MQKIVNVLAVASSVVSLAVVGSGIYVYVQRDQLIDNTVSYTHLTLPTICSV